MHCSKRIIFLKKMKSPLCPWHVAYFHPDQEDPRPSYPVPSIHHQTLLSKSIFEHCLDYAQVASIAMASKSIQNSSLSANFASNISINHKSVLLFHQGGVFHPSSSFPCSLLHRLNIAGPFNNNATMYDKDVDDDSTSSFLRDLKATKYFRKSVRSITLDTFPLDLIIMSSPPPSNNNNKNYSNEKVVDEFISLENLELENCPISTPLENLRSVLGTAFPRLRSIKYKSTHAKTITTNAEEFLENVKNLPKLTYFERIEPRDFDGLWNFGENFASSLPYLTGIKMRFLASSESSEQALLQISRLPNLTSLEFG